MSGDEKNRVIKNELERVRAWRPAEHPMLANDADAEQKEYLAAVRDNLADAAEVDHDLLVNGIPYSLSDLAHVRFPYPEAIPVLLKHLSKASRVSTIRTLIQALTVPYGGDDVVQNLILYLDAHCKAMDQDTLFAIGNAIATNAKRKHIPLLMEIAGKQEFDNARVQPIIKLGRLGKNNTPIHHLLLSILEEGTPYVADAVRALRLSQGWTAHGRVKALAESGDENVRREARNYLEAYSKK